MAQYKIAIDAGHGGSDSGATFEGRREKDDTLRLANAVGDILEQNGFEVVYIRTGDEYETPFKKATDANEAGADFFVSIHRNSSNVPNEYSGVQTLVYDDSGVKAQMARNINAQLAQIGYQNLGIEERPNLVVLRRTQMPAVLVEAGFINSTVDNELFDTRFEDTAQAIADGIMDTLYAQNATTASGNRVLSRVYTNNAVNQDETYDDPRETQPIPQSPPDNSWMNNGSIPNYYNNNMDDLRDDMRDTRNSIRFDTNPDSSPCGPGGCMDDMYDRRGERNNDIRNDREDSESERLYRVQVGAYRNKDSADRMLNSLLVEGFPAFIVFDNGIYKVQVGAFKYLSNAIKMEERLRRFRYNTYITL